jgi:hypothetical protein
MPLYRTYYMNADGHFTGILELSFANDEAAVADAEARLGEHHAIEVFEGGRRVARVEGQPAPRADDTLRPESKPPLQRRHKLRAVQRI